MSTALATRGLDKSFGSLVVAKDIAFSLPQGARYALIGPNGAGKTTLINLMTGMLRPDAGAILLGAEDITALPPERRVTRFSGGKLVIDSSPSRISPPSGRSMPVMRLISVVLPAPFGPIKA